MGGGLGKMSLLKTLLCSMLPPLAFAFTGAFAADNASAVDTVYYASQTMDIGIIAGLLALAISAVTIYFLRKRRR